MQPQGYGVPTDGATACPEPAGASAPAQQPFGCIIPGVAPITCFTEASEGHWVAPLGFAGQTVVVFLTGTIPVPEGQGLGVYLSRADEGEFVFLGFLTNECPSAMFHVPAAFVEVHRGVEVVLGLSLQSLGELNNLGNAPDLGEQQRAATHFQVAQKIADDLERCVLSYAKHVPAECGGADGEDTVVMPASWAVQWRKKLESKLASDRIFWCS